MNASKLTWGVVLKAVILLIRRENGIKIHVRIMATCLAITLIFFGALLFSVTNLSKSNGQQRKYIRVIGLVAVGRALIDVFFEMIENVFASGEV